MEYTNRRILTLLLAISAVVLNLSGCNFTSDSTLTSKKSPNTLTVITYPSKNTYFDGKKGPEGMEFQLINQFAKQNKYKLNVVLTNDQSEIFAALDQGLADIALLGEPLSFSRRKSSVQSLPYMDVTSQLIYRHGSGTPKSFDDLIGKKIRVQDIEQNREKYQFLTAHYPGLAWEFTNNSTEELIGMVNSGAIDYTVINSHDYLAVESRFTRTRVAFDLYYPENISFALSNDTSESFREQFNQYLTTAQEDGTVADLKERFYGHADDFNARGSMTFFMRVNKRLPQYQKDIFDIANEYNIDWRLMAAIAYQESHWDPKAKSPTGVRGMMMLTKGTAKDMGVENRLDAEQSLRGGAKYFKNVLRRLPDTIKEPDRTWFALAAYNVGLGHLLDARKITEFHDGNPDSWVDVKDYLPLLENKEWYSFTKYGQARGSEPVQYVQNIRHYTNLLEWRFPNGVVQNQDRDTKISIKQFDDAVREAKSKEIQPEDKPLKVSLFF